MQGYLVVALLFAVGLAVFVLQNPMPVTVHFINWESPKISLALVSLLAALLGALVTFMIDSFRYFKTMRKLKEVMSKNRKLEAKLNKLTQGDSGNQAVIKEAEAKEQGR